MLTAAFRLERPYQSLDPTRHPRARAQGARKIQRAEEEDTGDKRYEPRGEIERAGPSSWLACMVFIRSPRVTIPAILSASITTSLPAPFLAISCKASVADVAGLTVIVRS